MTEAVLQEPPPCRTETVEVFLFRSKGPYLGHVISMAGVSTYPEAVKFLGWASYYRRFIEDFTGIASPFHRLTANTNEKFRNQVDTRVQCSLRHPKGETSHGSHLGLWNLWWTASDKGLAAVLSHCQNGQGNVVTYASLVLNDQERRYITTKKEIVAMVP